MTHYDTLDAALEDIAKRSFYDDATVTPIPTHSFSESTFTGAVTCDYCGLMPLDDDDLGAECGYEVADDYATSFPGDVLLWDDVSGVDWPSNADDHSRLHDPAEYYATAEHIRYNLGAAVEALERDQSVTFAYAIVDATFCDDHAYPEECECDRTAGWALLAAIHDN